MAITPIFNFQIQNAFAVNGLRQTVPQTSTGTDVNYSAGYTDAYQTPLDEGGRPIEMVKMNEIFYQAYAAIKELQVLLTSGQFTAQEANALTGTLPISSGGTGGTTAAEARTNLGITAYTPKAVYSPAVFTKGVEYSGAVIISSFIRMFGASTLTLHDIYPFIYSDEGSYFKYGFLQVLMDAASFKIIYGSNALAITAETNYTMPVNVYGDGIAAAPVDPDVPEPLTYSLDGAGAYQQSYEIAAGYTLLEISLTFSTGDVEGIDINFNGDSVISSGPIMSGTFNETAALNGQAGTLNITIATLDSSVQRTGYIKLN